MPTTFEKIVQFQKPKSHTRLLYTHSSVNQKPRHMVRAFRSRLTIELLSTRDDDIFGPLQRHEWIRGRSVESNIIREIESTAKSLLFKKQDRINHLERKVTR